MKPLISEKDTHRVQKDFDRRGNTGLAQVPILVGVILFQRSHQRRYIYIVVVVKVTPEPAKRAEREALGIASDVEKQKPLICH